MQPGADKDATDANGERPLYWATESTVGGGWEARRSEPLAALVAEARLHTRAGQSGAGGASESHSTRGGGGCGGGG